MRRDNGARHHSYAVQVFTGAAHVCRCSAKRRCCGGPGFCPLLRDRLIIRPGPAARGPALSRARRCLRSVTPLLSALSYRPFQSV